MTPSVDLRDAVAAAAGELQAGRAAAVLSADLVAWQLEAAAIGRAARWVDGLVAVAPTVGPVPDWSACLEMALDGAPGPEASGITAPRRRSSLRDAERRVGASERPGKPGRPRTASGARAGVAGTPSPGGALAAAAAARVATRLEEAAAYSAPSPQRAGRIAARTKTSPPHTAGEPNATEGIGPRSRSEAAVPTAPPHPAAGATPGPPPPPEGAPAPAAGAGASSLLSALGREWQLPLDGPRASADVLVRVLQSPTGGAATTVVAPGDRATRRNATPDGPRATAKTPEGPGERAARERPVVSASAEVETGGSVVPPELMVRESSIVAGGARATTATGRVETDATRRPPDGPLIPTGTGVDPFYDLDELAERVGTILQEEARRSGIDV